MSETNEAKCELCGEPMPEGEEMFKYHGYMAGGCPKPPLDKDKIGREKFEEAVRPLMKYLSENHHPHTLVMVHSTSAEILEGLRMFNTKEFIRSSPRQVKETVPVTNTDERETIEGDSSR